jgi:hypothetical protein
LEQEFGLATFFPAAYQDYPESWVQLPEGARMLTGRVRQVLRPGLRDRSGGLRVPARVEAE